MSQEVIRFPNNVEIGKFYIVPCVKNMNGHYIPINSYLHDDKKLIGATFKHWHIDWRFVSDSFWQSEVGWYNERTARAKSSREGGIPIALMDKSKATHESTTAISENIFYKKRKCKRPYSVYSFFEDHKTFPAKWVETLSNHFCGSKLKQDGDKLICPHKGILIDKNCKDADGNYVCPGHLLRFNPKTLMCIKNKNKTNAKNRFN